MFGSPATSTLKVTATGGTKDIGPVQPTTAPRGWHLIMMASSTLTATGMAIMARLPTTINGIKKRATTGTTITTIKTTTGTITTTSSSTGEKPQRAQRAPRSRFGRVALARQAKACPTHAAQLTGAVAGGACFS